MSFPIAERHTLEFSEASSVVVSAPGVGFILGEHTEFCSGMAIGFALPLRTFVAVSRRNDSSLRFYAADLDEKKRCSLSNLKFKREDRWANYLKGVLHGLANAGCTLGGLNITFSGNIPPNRGLFSSGSICLALAKAAALALGYNISDAQLIQAVIFAERHFVQSPYVSPLEIYLSLYSKRGQLSIIDQRNFAIEYFKADFPTAAMLLIDTQVPQTDFLEDLMDRIDACTIAAKELRSRVPGGDYRLVSPKEFRGMIGQVSESVRRICTHAVNEHFRFTELMTHLKTGSLQAAGKVMNRSQEDLRDLFEVSCPEVDWIAKHTTELPGVFCSRLTGVGIASCALTMYEKSVQSELLSRLEEYERIFGFHPQIHHIAPDDGLLVHTS